MNEKKTDIAEMEPEVQEDTTFELTSYEDGKEKKVGFILKKTREKKKKDIQKIADTLRIRVRYLEALEESRYEDFPGQTYAFGFLRNYADFLGLDVDALLAEYRKETSFLKPDVLDMPITERPKLFPAPKYLFWAILVIALIWSFWYLLTYAETQEPVPPILVAEEPVMTEEIQKMDALESEVLGAPVVAEVMVEQPVVVSAPVVPVAAPSAAKSRVQIIAKEEVWLEIEQDDTLILSRTLKSGEVYNVPTSGSELFLKTGNAGGMDILVDGVKIKSLGPVGAVRSGISLSADKLKNR